MGAGGDAVTDSSRLWKKAKKKNIMKKKTIRYVYPSD